MDSPRLILMGNRNDILEPNLDRGRGASGKAGDRSLVDVIEEFGHVDRYLIDHTGWARENVDVSS